MRRRRPLGKMLDEAEALAEQGLHDPVLTMEMVKSILFLVASATQREIDLNKLFADGWAKEH